MFFPDEICLTLTCTKLLYVAGYNLYTRYFLRPGFCLVWFLNHYPQALICINYWEQESKTEPIKLE